MIQSSSPTSTPSRRAVGLARPARPLPLAARPAPPPAPAGPAEYWRVERVARHLDISRKRVYQLIEEGRLEALRLGPRQIRVARASLATFIEQLAAAAGCVD